MFSAIAMMAFSVSSMGNTITCQEEEKELSVEKTQIITDTPCADGAAVVYNYLRTEMNLTHSEAWRLSTIAFNRCMVNTYNTN